VPRNIVRIRQKGNKRALLEGSQRRALARPWGPIKKGRVGETIIEKSLISIVQQSKATTWPMEPWLENQLEGNETPRGKEKENPYHGAHRGGRGGGTSTFLEGELLVLGRRSR